MSVFQAGEAYRFSLQFLNYRADNTAFMNFYSYISSKKVISKEKLLNFYLLQKNINEGLQDYFATNNNLYIAFFLFP